MTTALLIIDVQNDYFKAGAMELIGMEEAASNCRLLLDYFRTAKKPVFHVQHLSVQPGAFFFIPDTHGCEIHEWVRPLSNETIIVKHYPSSFRDTGLQGVLQDSGVTELVVCGAMSHMCIDTTVRAAFDLGYDCKVVSDACATRNLEFEGKVIDSSDVHGTIMAALKLVFATVLTTRDYLGQNR